jgi:hypothetical protein
LGAQRGQTVAGIGGGIPAIVANTISSGSRTRIPARSCANTIVCADSRQQGSTSVGNANMLLSASASTAHTALPNP